MNDILCLLTYNFVTMNKKIFSDADFRNQPENKEKQETKTQECQHEWVYAGEKRYNYEQCDVEYLMHCLHCSAERWE